MEEVHWALKTVGTEKSSQDHRSALRSVLGFSHILVEKLATIYNNWMKQGSIPQPFTGSIVKLLRKDIHSGDGISNFRLLTILV